MSLEVHRQVLRKNIIDAAKAELARRRNTPEYKAFVRAAILASLFDKQLEVVEMIRSGTRYISLCTSRRAGKTNLLAKLIVLTLLDAGFNQAVLYVAPTLEWGKKLIWAEVEAIVNTYQLGWNMKEHFGTIETPAGAHFVILGLNKRGQVAKPRGFDALMCLTDESQEYEYLLKPLLTAVGPALAGRNGVFIAAGTPGYSLDGDWHDICHGSRGFTPKHWTVLDNTRGPKPGAEILEDEKRLNGWNGTEPEFQREWLGRWVQDTNRSVYEYDPTKNVVLTPEDYKGPDWDRVIGIDYGFVHPTAWAVVAVNKYDGRKVVCDFRKEARLIGDRAVEITAELVQEWDTTYVVADPGGGGIQFYENFNAKYGQALGTVIRAANKIDKAGSIHNMNTELRTGRLQLLMPVCGELSKELTTVRYKGDNKNHSDLVLDPRYGDDGCDGARYALNEVMAWATKEKPREESADDRRQRELLAKARARERQVSQGWWGNGR